MTCNPYLRAFAIQQEAIRLLIEKRPDLTLRQAEAAMRYIAARACGEPKERHTINGHARRILKEANDQNHIPPFD